MLWRIMWYAGEHHYKWFFIKNNLFVFFSSELDCCGKIVRLLLILIKVSFFLAFLYLFICSLDFLSSAFKLLGGKSILQLPLSNYDWSLVLYSVIMTIFVTHLNNCSTTLYCCSTWIKPLQYCVLDLWYLAIVILVL